MITSVSDIQFQTRSHPKILFVPLVIQLALIALHIAVAIVWPHITGLFGVTTPWWVQGIVHGLIVLVEAWYVILPALRWWNRTFVLTSTSVVVQWGVIWRQAREIPLNRIASIQTELGLLDRIWGCGTLIFQDAAFAPMGPQTPMTKRATDRLEFGVRFHDVPHVRHVRSVIDEARHGFSREA